MFLLYSLTRSSSSKSHFLLLKVNCQLQRLLQTLLILTAGLQYFSRMTWNLGKGASPFCHLEYFSSESILNNGTLRTIILTELFPICFIDWETNAQLKIRNISHLPCLLPGASFQHEWQLLTKTKKTCFPSVFLSFL